jgi:putative two-component system hydrogenase maturation factor HypX/HoxX
MSFRVGLVYSRFAGMPQAMWGALRDDGHDVVRPEDLGFDTPLSPEDMAAFAERAGADVLFCPFLKEVVPPSVCERWTTWIPHPGILGDGGPSSLSWAILDAEPTWGVTLVRAEPATAAEQLDSGNVGAWREFPLPGDVTVGEAYAQYVTPAAVACAREVLARMRDEPGYVGVPLARFGEAVRGRFRPALTQADLAFSWEDEPDAIARRIRAATFGVRTELAGQAVNVFDAHPHDTEGTHVQPGAVLAHRDGALLVGAGGGGALWVGHAKVRVAEGGRGLKLPAVEAVHDRLHGLRERSLHPDRRRGCPRTHQAIRYHREGRVGFVHAEPYNGAWSTRFCGRLLAALRYAAQQDTDAIALVGGRAAWGNGIHLGVIEAAADPEAEAWANIRRIDDVAEFVFGLPRGRTDLRPQATIAVLGASAGAGGAVLSACFDVVLSRPTINLNYHYATMGLSGSELRSLVLPLRAGAEEAKRLLTECLPTTPTAARDLGLVDDIGPDEPAAFDAWMRERAAEVAGGRLEPRPVIDTAPYRQDELHDMARDIFDDRHGFAAKRRAFLGVTAPAEPVRRLAVRRPADPFAVGRPPTLGFPGAAR